MESALRKLQQRYKQRKVGGFYCNMPPMKKKVGSCNVCGTLSSYSYHKDKGTGKLVRDI